MMKYSRLKKQALTNQTDPQKLYEIPTLSDTELLSCLKTKDEQLNGSRSSVIPWEDLKELYDAYKQEAQTRGLIV